MSATVSIAKISLLGGAALAVLATACVARNDDPPSYRSGGGGQSSSSSSSSGTSGTTPSGTTPILVDIDTDKTMNAAAGEGVGVFTEYASGGHWHIWWTCDTNVNTAGPLTCEFAVKASISQGVITLKSDAPVGASQVTTNGQEIDLSTTTGAEIHGFTFDTDPGVVVTLEATIGGQKDGHYFFFVQNGQVNGGYSGTLTDPLELEGTKP